MQPETHYFQPDGDIPNNPDLPLLLYRKAVQSSDLALYFLETFLRNGWGGTWQNGIFDYTHFHSKSHEVLGVASGHARVQLGGDHGGLFEIDRGDLLVLPAGTGHKLIVASRDFVVIGAYPKGQEDYDIMCSVRDDPACVDRIASVPLPDKDPLTGRVYPLPDVWGSNDSLTFSCRA